LVAECRLLLANVTLQINISDTWQWHPDITWGYSVRSGYRTLSAQIPPVLDDSEKLIWHSQVPSKVSILVWRLLRDRLPTKSNLIDRDIISVDDSLCVAGCGQIKTAQHLLLIVIFLTRYSSKSDRGLVFQVLIATSQAHTSLNLQITWEAGEVVDHFFSFCGFFKCCSYGKNVIIEFLIMFILPLWTFRKK